MTNVTNPSDYCNRPPASWAKRVLWRSLWITLTCTTLAGIGGFVYVAFQPPVYSAVATVKVIGAPN